MTKYEYREFRVGPIEDWLETCTNCGLTVPWGTLNRDRQCPDCHLIGDPTWR